MNEGHNRISDLARGVVGLCALAVVAIGAGARSRLSLRLERSWVTERFGQAGTTAFALVGLACVVILGIAVARVLRRRRDSAHPALQQARPSALARFVALLLVLGVLVAPWLFAQFAMRPSPPVTPPSAPGNHGLRPAGQGSVAQVGHGATTAIMAVVAIIIACALIAIAGRRLRRWLERDRVTPAVAQPREETPDHKETFTRAAREGAVAMRDIADPREAIIACYNAMRRSLSGAGVVQKRSDTPTQLLSRARDAGVSPAAAGLLTSLFLEARFSTHPMDFAKRQNALDALADISGAVARP